MPLVKGFLYGHFKVILNLSMKICVCIRKHSVQEAAFSIKKAQKCADFVEIWFDKLKIRDFEKLIKLSTKPVIAVCRGAAEKGSFKGSEAARVRILKEAVKAGAKFVDIGAHTNRRLLNVLKLACKKFGARVIVSHHFWNKTPDLNALLKFIKKARMLGADIVKTACYVKNWQDNVVLFELAKRAHDFKYPVIITGMGPKSAVSRIGCGLLGSYISYFALDEKSRTAEGQMTIQRDL